MIVIVVTGLCGAGKSTYCQKSGFPTLKYDSIYSYSTHKINHSSVVNFFNNNKTKDKVYLDAYNKELIEKVNSLDQVNEIYFRVIYNDIDENYTTISQTDPRKFDTTKYDEYVDTMVKTIRSIISNVKEMTSTYNKVSGDVEYIYRNQNSYQSYTVDTHLNGILSESKDSRLMKFIRKISGHSTYQSIVMDGKYLQRGSERDWITWSNVMKCVNLKDKVVMDTGCFNGYFSFVALEQKPKQVIGIDHNQPAIDICNKICIYNNYHMYKDGQLIDNTCPKGIQFHMRKIGVNKIFGPDIVKNPVDVIFAFNYLHHLKNELGHAVFREVIDSFFKNSKEVVFEINQNEIDDVKQIATKNGFKLNKNIESHRKTQFGNRFVQHYFK